VRQRLLDLVSTPSPWLQRGAIAIGLLGVVLIGAIDYWTVLDLSLSIFYILPIACTTWVSGRSAGIFLTLIATAIWLIDEQVAKPTLPLWLIGWNTAIHLIVLLIITLLLALLRHAYDQEKYLVQTDPLTGCSNRRHFRELLQLEIERSHRYGHPLTLAYLDVDNFKLTNDLRGHGIGDRLLCLISQITHQQTRSLDVFARLGGDKFALLLPQTDYYQGQTALHRLRRQLLDRVQQEGFPVTFSLGAVTFRMPPNSADAMMREADLLMDKAKQRGKDRLEHVVAEGLPQKEA